MRFKCEVQDLLHFIVENQLTPSIYLNYKGYPVFQISYEEEYDGRALSIIRARSPDFIDIGDGYSYLEIGGFHHLVFMRRKGTFEGEFSYVSKSAENLEHGDVIYEIHPPLDLQDVLRVGVVMADELARFEAKNINKADASQEKSLGTTERGTLLKLVIGMAIFGYRYDPLRSKNEATSEIAKDLVKLGMSVSDDTVRKYLKEATDAVLPAKPLQ